MRFGGSSGSTCIGSCSCLFISASCPICPCALQSPRPKILPSWNFRTVCDFAGASSSIGGWGERLTLISDQGWVLDKVCDSVLALLLMDACRAQNKSLQGLWCAMMNEYELAVWFSSDHSIGTVVVILNVVVVDVVGRAMVFPCRDFQVNLFCRRCLTAVTRLDCLKSKVKQKRELIQRYKSSILSQRRTASSLYFTTYFLMSSPG